MNEAALQLYLREHFPKENAACEWKEFKNLTHAVSGRKGEDIASYLSAIANMAGGHLVIGVEDASLRIVGIDNFHDYTPENIRQRLLGRCTNLNSEGFRIESFTTSDTAKVVWIFHIPQHQPRLPVYAHDKAWQRLDDALVEMRPERLAAILSEPVDNRDWSAETVEGATLADLDEQAFGMRKEVRQLRATPRRNRAHLQSIDQILITLKRRAVVAGLLQRLGEKVVGDRGLSIVAVVV